MATQLPPIMIQAAAGQLANLRAQLYNPVGTTNGAELSGNSVAGGPGFVDHGGGIYELILAPVTIAAGSWLKLKVYLAGGIATPLGVTVLTADSSSRNVTIREVAE